MRIGKIKLHLKISNFKIHNKILLSLACLFSLLVLVAVASFIGSERIEEYRLMALQSENKIATLTQLRAAVRNRFLETYEFFIIPSDFVKITKVEAEVNSAWLQIQNLFSTAEDRKSLEPLKAAYGTIDKELNELIVLIKNGHGEIAKGQLIDVREEKFNTTFIREITNLLDIERAREIENSDELKIRTEFNNRLVQGIALFGIFMTLLLAYLLASSIREKLADLDAGAMKVSQGDFDLNIPIRDQDELSMLANSFNLMAESLREKQEQLVAQQAMLTANSKMSALGEMAGGVAHEINTPLATIQLFAAHLNRCIKEKNFDVKIFTESLASIDATVKRIAIIVSGLRSFSRDGSRDPVMTYSLSKIVVETLALCQDKFTAHQIEIKFKNLSFAPINCRPSEISQVLINLLNNSIDAIESLDEKWIQVKIEECSKFFRIAVIDSGAGISNEVQEKLMQPFFTTKEIGKGTGLGLSISKGLVEGHGGTLFVDSTCSNTCFIITLPKT